MAISPQNGRDVSRAVADRQLVEKKIIEEVIKQALAFGYRLGVNDGEETTLKESKDAAEILGKMFTTDEDWLLVYWRGKAHIGWIRLVYGNDGYDVICDYTVNLDHLLGDNTPVDLLVKSLE